MVRPEAWNNWKKPEAQSTVRYAEFNSAGAEANPAARVKWARQLTAKESKALTLQNVLRGHDRWNPQATP